MSTVTPGRAFREELHRRWTARGLSVDTRSYDDLPEEDRADLEAAAMAAVSAVTSAFLDAAGVTMDDVTSAMKSVLPQESTS